MESAKLYIFGNERVSQIFQPTAPMDIGILTALGEKIVKNWRVEEVLIDYNFKIDQQNLELFMVIVTFMGVGLQLEYFLLNDGTGDGLNSREEYLSFLHHVRLNVSSLRPKVFTRTKRKLKLMPSSQFSS